MQNYFIELFNGNHRHGILNRRCPRSRARCVNRPSVD
ncbi:hypothetical protein [Xanthomonas sp. NCPPB 1754]